MDIYRDEMLDHARNPRNQGKVANPTFEFHASNPLCGDTLDLQIKMQGKPPKVSEVAFQANACTVSVAAASMLTEKIKGMTTSELSKLDEKEVISWFGGSLTTSRTECAFLPLKALREATRAGF
ncbi:hypothetical protein A3J33_01980 [candidate division WWE3 bacterium RIFCSPLOWO2_02_FULL_53_10]|uniref:NIF system FeS cluster assembly NifU N-terminal domain-containing protein n=2 Tax=Katanobacteria TaxID=422282 RepID=A0A1F4WQ95_UNCKA|nr:MAG: hypothetical protein A2890_02930 [candidate division WWE3 bacterium RIFCSPLOWO2_01_FULL_53_14]OGC71538.1 MAG: hypothetical protein A3J33_01980 [candidate division WWE3 bacterium RIFCSPLOWO2_02_FULL_53_10]